MSFNNPKEVFNRREIEMFTTGVFPKGATAGGRDRDPRRIDWDTSLWRPSQWGTLKKHIQCGAPKIAKLVQMTPVTMIYGYLWYL